MQGHNHVRELHLCFQLPTFSRTLHLQTKYRDLDELAVEEAEDRHTM
jgi:hypothetical protein